MGEKTYSLTEPIKEELLIVTHAGRQFTQQLKSTTKDFETKLSKILTKEKKRVRLYLIDHSEFPPKAQLPDFWKAIDFRDYWKNKLANKDLVGMGHWGLSVTPDLILHAPGGMFSPTEVQIKTTNILVIGGNWTACIKNCLGSIMSSCIDHQAGQSVDIHVILEAIYEGGRTAKVEFDSHQLVDIYRKILNLRKKRYRLSKGRKLTKDDTTYQADVESFRDVVKPMKNYKKIWKLAAAYVVGKKNHGQKERTRITKSELAARLKNLFTIPEAKHGRFIAAYLGQMFSIFGNILLKSQLKIRVSIDHFKVYETGRGAREFNIYLWSTYEAYSSK